MARSSFAVNEKKKKTVLLCTVWFFRCRVDVLQSLFSRSTISFAEFSVSTQCIFLLIRSFIDPTFCVIFVCGPLQFKCQQLV